MMLNLFADAVVAALLIATISYAAVLNRRLSVLRGDRAKLEELVQGLTVAAQRAELGVSGLREAAADVGRSLERTIERAKTLRDDLSYLLDRGGGIADRLEGTIRARRDPAEPAKREAKPEAPKPVEPRLVPAPDEARARPAPSRAERELIRALAGR